MIWSRPGEQIASAASSRSLSLDLRRLIHTEHWWDEIPLTATLSAIVSRDRVRLPAKLSLSSRMRARSYETLCPTTMCAVLGSPRDMSCLGSADWSRGQGEIHEYHPSETLRRRGQRMDNIQASSRRQRQEQSLDFHHGRGTRHVR